MTRIGKRSRGPARRARVRAAVVAAVVVLAVVLAAAALRLHAGAQSAEAEARAYTPPAVDAAVSNGTTITVPADPRLLIMGDSYTYGSGASTPTNGYAYRVAAQLGWTHRIDGVPGTGFTYDGPNGTDQRYTTRIAALKRSGDFVPNVVVLEGGQNDFRASQTKLQAAVVATVAQLRRDFPGVQVVIFGPAAPEPLFDGLGNIDQAIAQGAVQARAPYISPVQEGWITTANSARFRADDAHLNDLGQIDLSSRFLIDFVAIGG